MDRYLHYSFDLWLTLIRSNPDFKRERAGYFHRYYNPKDKSLEDVVSVFRQVDIMCNRINERVGGNIAAEEMYLMVISMLHEQEVDLRDIDIAGLYNAMEDLLMEHLPQVYETATTSVLETLKGSGYSLNILSNTGFIKGSTLRKVLCLLGLDRFFDFQLYSDEFGMSKPNRSFFIHMLREVEQLKGAELDPGLVLHTGDNPVADIEGGRGAGVATFLINSNEQTILSLLQHAPALFVP
ncbi:MAG: HAD family hydrolase [Sphingobacteriales bacterium]|nr:MAG: HAD family hydrolase [Sphingobacteriales bacterium]